MCDLSLSSSQSVPDLCASFSTINRGGTPEISNCIHSFSVPGKERRRERGREGGRERKRQSAERVTRERSEEGYGEEERAEGEKGREGPSLRHYSGDIIRATVCLLIRINTHKQRQSAR